VGEWVKEEKGCVDRGRKERGAIGCVNRGAYRNRREVEGEREAGWGGWGGSQGESGGGVRGGGGGGMEGDVMRVNRRGANGVKGRGRMMGKKTE